MSKKKEREGKEPREPLTVMDFITYTAYAALVFALGFYWWNFGRQLTPSTQPENWGQFGDYFGGFGGTIIAFLAVMLLAASFDQNRNLLAATKKAAGAADIAAKKQAEAMAMQRADDRFFAALGHIHSLIQSFPEKNERSGALALRGGANRIVGVIDAHLIQALAPDLKIHDSDAFYSSYTARVSSSSDYQNLVQKVHGLSSAI